MSDVQWTGEWRNIQYSSYIYIEKQQILRMQYAGSVFKDNRQLTKDSIR